MNAREWPNGRGWDVAQHEVHKSDTPGRLTVRLFRSRAHCEPYQVLHVHAQDPITALVRAREMHRKLKKIDR